MKKIFLAMIDSLGGPDRVNNLLSTLNIPTINNKTLMVMERRAGENVEAVAKVLQRRRLRKLIMWKCRKLYSVYFFCSDEPKKII